MKKDAEKERKVTLRMTANRFIVIDADSKVPITDVGFADIRSAAYSQRKVWRFVMVTQHWLTMTTSSGQMEFRLDKDNYEDILKDIDARSTIKVARIP